MNPNPGVILQEDTEKIRDNIPNGNKSCIGSNCNKNKNTISIDCSGPDCLNPLPKQILPPNNDDKPCNKTCTPGVDCPCIPGVDCPCVKGNIIYSILEYFIQSYLFILNFGK